MNAPNGFQQIMRTILASLDGVICEVYLDDVIISGDNPADLIENINQVLMRLNDFNVLVKPSKCKFGMTEIEFLGHVINKHERRLLPSRTQKVLDLPTPRTPKQVRTFLGLCNAFKDYIPGFALMQKTFSKLTSKENKFNWTSVHEKQFHETKNEIKNATARFHVTYKDPIILQVDASDDGVAASTS
jgi:hypothetical protein